VSLIYNFSELTNSCICDILF